MQWLNYFLNTSDLNSLIDKSVSLFLPHPLLSSQGRERKITSWGKGEYDVKKVLPDRMVEEASLFHPGLGRSAKTLGMRQWGQIQFLIYLCQVGTLRCKGPGREARNIQKGFMQWEWATGTLPCFGEACYWPCSTCLGGGRTLLAGGWAR